MTKVATVCIGILLTLVAFTPALAETRYIDDTLFAPLRSGEGLGFRIVHKGVRSGTRLELISSNRETGYSKVRTPSGIEGWLPTRFLSKQPIARTQLEKLTKEHNSLLEKFGEISKQNKEINESNSEMTRTNRELSSNNEELKAELADIKRISANAVTLDKRNIELRQMNEQLKNELEVQTSENTRLRESNERDKMLLGGALVISGIIIAVVIPMFKKDKRDTW